MDMNGKKILLLSLLPALLGAPVPALQAAPTVVVKEAWTSQSTPEDDVDSVAFWQGGGQALAVATTKATHQLLVYDAASGQLLRRSGSLGREPGQFARPNGIMILDDLAIVAERDNHRIQVLRLPGLEPLGSFGEQQLRRPYGLTVFRNVGGYELYVTDNYETAQGTIPPPRELGQRVVRFRFRVDGGKVLAEHVSSFGETSGQGVLRKVETIFADPQRNRLWIAEELVGKQSFKVYSLDGKFLHEEAGKGDFKYEPEGLALWKCGQDGYWIATDQSKEKSFFRVYDRRSAKLLGTFKGEKTANTDGVGLTQESTERFPGGAFFAVHDDQAVSAFDWREIAAALGLAARCGGQP
jgi:3-phytase